MTDTSLPPKAVNVRKRATCNHFKFCECNLSSFP